MLFRSFGVGCRDHEHVLGDAGVTAQDVAAGGGPDLPRDLDLDEPELRGRRGQGVPQPLWWRAVLASRSTVTE